jgi:hypothetical protein
MAGDQLADSRGHLPAVPRDVSDEIPGDPVVHADRIVLPAAVPEATPDDAPKTRPGREVQEDDGVRGMQPDRQAGGVVAVDDPPRRGYQVPLQDANRSRSSGFQSRS